MEGRIESRKLNHKLNANTQKEQSRLKAEFPDDPNIFKCRSNSIEKACYVKGRLQVTYAFADFVLKHPEFAKRKAPSGREGQPVAFKGPYIKSEPQIVVVKREQNMHGVLLATDGLWDELKKPEVGPVFSKHFEDSEGFLTALVDDCLAKASMKHMIKKTDLETMQLGKRRDFHDDISVVFVRLD